MPSEVLLSNRVLGPDSPAYVIAEAGVHHYNSMTLAKELIVKARVAGADAIKFQTYKADRIAAKWAPAYWDVSSELTQHDIFSERSLLTRAQYEELFAFAAEAGITFLSTPFDTDSAEMLDELGMEAFKIASADITDLPLLQRVSSFGKPVLLSTGAATFEEVEQAVRAVREAGAAVALLHCNLSYPTAIADANLGRIGMLRDRFPGIPIGYSDHTRPADSMVVCPLAAGLGACIIEKHFTLNRLLPEDDHYHSVDPAGLARLVTDCRDAWTMTSSPVETTESEMAARTFARRSIVAARDLPAGHVLTEQDVDFKRPGTGMPPTRLHEVVGARLSADVEADALIVPEVFDRTEPEA